MLFYIQSRSLVDFVFSITNLSMVDGNTPPGKITIDDLQREERKYHQASE